MLVRGASLVLLQWEASTLEQIQVPIIVKPLAVVVKSNTALAGYLNRTQKLSRSVGTCKRHLMIKEEDTVLSLGSLFDSLLCSDELGLGCSFNRSCRASPCLRVGGILVSLNYS